MTTSEKFNSPEQPERKNKAKPMQASAAAGAEIKQGESLEDFKVQPSPAAMQKPLKWRPFEKLSLRVKVTTLAVAFSTIPVLAVGVAANYFANQTITKQIIGEKSAQTVNMADRVSRFVNERYNDIQDMASLPVFVDPGLRAAATPQQKAAVLRDIIENSDGLYNSIAIFEMNGDLIAQGETGEPLPNHFDRDYFQEVLKTDKPAIAQPRPSRTTGVYSLHFAAPVKDAVSGQTIAIIRSRSTVEDLEEFISNYGQGATDYLLLNNQQDAFISENDALEGEKFLENLPEIASVVEQRESATLEAIEQLSETRKLVTYAPISNLPDQPALDWSAALLTPTSEAFAAERQLLFTIIFGTTVTAIGVSLLAAYLSNRAIRPILTATDAVEKIGQGELDTRLQMPGEDELAALGANINRMASQIKSLVTKQASQTKRERILAEVANAREAQELQSSLTKLLLDVRAALNADRTVVYRFDKDWNGKVIAESVAEGWPQALDAQINDPCFANNYVGKYKKGRVHVLDNIYEAGLTECYLKQLEPFKVKANLVVPIVNSVSDSQEGELFGLLIAHQCSEPRHWQSTEIDYLKGVAEQLEIALRGFTLIQLQQAEAQRERQDKEALQQELFKLLSDVEGASSGDLTVRAEISAGEIGIIADFFNAIIENLRGLVTQVKQAATQVNSSVGENEGTIGQLATEAIQQANQISTTLNSVEEMTRSIQEVADNARQAADVARTPSTTAETGGEAMDRTVESILQLRETVAETAKKVKRLGESSQQISKVISLINQIALKTNLLAVNASIEAARAGEEGRGFAVVAEEVGELAAQSANATKEIEKIIENIQLETSQVVEAMEQGTTQVVEGTKLVAQTKQSLEQIVGVSRQIDQLLQSISQATISQAQTSQSVTSLMGEISQLSGRTSDTSRLVSSSLRETVAIAQQLQSSVETFKVESNK